MRQIGVPSHQRLTYPCQHLTRSLQHLVLSESEGMHTMRSQLLVAPPVIACFCSMYRSIDFNGEPRLGAVEVEDEVANRVLSPEPHPELPGSKGFPEHPLTSGCVRALVAGECNLLPARDPTRTGLWSVHGVSSASGHSVGPLVMAGLAVRGASPPRPPLPVSAAARLASASRAAAAKEGGERRTASKHCAVPCFLSLAVECVGRTSSLSHIGSSLAGYPTAGRPAGAAVDRHFRRLVSAGTALVVSRTPFSPLFRRPVASRRLRRNRPETGRGG